MQQLPDEITFTLHFNDIQDISESLTNEEAKQILQIIKRKGEPFDSETIYAWIDYFKRSHNEI